MGLRLTGLVPAGLVCERVIKRGRVAGSVRWRDAGRDGSAPEEASGPRIAR